MKIGVYKYNGSVCGASFAIPQIAGLFLLSRQIDKEISFDKFIEIVRDPKIINKDGMKYINAKEIINKVKENKKMRRESKLISYSHDQKSDQYFEDMKIVKYTIPASKIGKVTINAPTQAKKQAEHEETENMITEDKIM